MKKETGIILFVIGLVVGFGIGLITMTAMKPGATRKSYQQQATMPPSGGSPESYANTQAADKKAANNARVMKEIEGLKYALEKDPDNIEIIVSLGNNYFDAQQYYKAIEFYNKALAINPNRPNVLVDLGIMYRRTENLEKAIEVFNKAIEVDPKHPNAQLNLGVVYNYNLKKYDESLKYYEKFLELAPSNHSMIPQVKQEVTYLKQVIASGGKPVEQEHGPGDGHDH
ncbi:tetratricopeptide repeat protein [Thermodesulfobacteriota bacterium]